MITLELDTAAITQYLKSFKSQLSNILSNLFEVDQLRPYILPAVIKRVVETDESSSDESIAADMDEDIPHDQRRRRRRRAIVDPKVLAYPLTESQESVLNVFRHADTLIFTNLPSADCVMKLIALSAQVTGPFYGHVLFPNVKKVVFTSTTQEKSLVERYDLAANNVDSLPHPITFALDWLVYDFSLCIHSANSSFRDQWINSHVKKDESILSSVQLKENYKRRWNALGPLNGTVAIGRLPRLQSITYHGIIPGDKPQLSHEVETYLHFGPHWGRNEDDANDTLHAIAKPLAVAIRQGLTEKFRIHLIDIEYLEHEKLFPYGPRVTDERLSRRRDGFIKLCREVRDLFEAKGVVLDDQGRKRVVKMIGGDEYKTCGSPSCHICGEACQDLSCSKSSTASAPINVDPSAGR